MGRRISKETQVRMTAIAGVCLFTIALYVLAYSKLHVILNSRSHKQYTGYTEPKE